MRKSLRASFYRLAGRSPRKASDTAARTSPSTQPAGSVLPGTPQGARALAAYVLVTLAMTYPLLPAFARAIPGDGFDGWQNYWNLWWVKTALLDLHTQPFFTPLLYAPTGVGLLFHTLNPFNGLLTLPVQIAWMLIPAYNLVVVFSFAMGGFGAYLLARQSLGPGQRSHLPAFAAGLVFTFAPVHVAHLLGHMQVLSLEWIPFYALYLLRLAQPGRTHARARRSHDVLMASLFLVLIALCDWYFVLYCGVLTAVIVIWSAWSAARTGRAVPVESRPGGFLGRLLAVMGVWLAFGLVLSPLLAPMIHEASQSRFMVPDPDQSRTLSADLLAFVTPQEFHPLWGQWARRQAAVFTATVSEHQVFAGYTVLCLAGLGLWGMRKARPPRSRYKATSLLPGPWPLALLTFFVLSLGPVLHIAGRTQLGPNGSEISLPYGWLAHAVPFMDITRSVSRFDIMVMLVIAVLAAAGVRWLIERWTATAGFPLAIVAVALVLFEFLPAPYPLSLPDTPGWYDSLAADRRPGTVLNLPMNWDRPGYLLYQTVHGKPLAVAYISREDPRTLTERAPVLQHFRHLGPDIIQFDLAAQGTQVLYDLGVRWVVLDRYKMPGERERSYNEQTAQLIFGAQPPEYQDERLTVYEVQAPPHPAPYLLLGVGWGAFDAAQRTRPFVGSAPVIIQAPAAGQATLRIRVAPDSAALDLPLSAGGYFMPLTLHAGANEAILRASQPGGHVVISSLALEQP